MLFHFRWDHTVGVARGAEPRVAALDALLELMLRRDYGCRVARRSQTDSGVATVDELPSELQYHVGAEAHVLQVLGHLFVFHPELEAHQVSQRVSVVRQLRGPAGSLRDGQDALHYIVPVHWEAGEIAAHCCPMVEVHGLQGAPREQCTSTQGGFTYPSRTDFKGPGR